MKRFSRKQVVIAAIAVAALVSQWPPYFRQPDRTDRIGFNEDFWAVAGLEAFIFVVVALTRKADSLRRELDEPPPQGEAAPTPPRYRRRWPRFSLRTLFVAMTALGIWIAWDRHVTYKRLYAIYDLSQLGATVGSKPMPIWWSPFRRIFHDIAIREIDVPEGAMTPASLSETRTMFPEANVLWIDSHGFLREPDG